MSIRKLISRMALLAMVVSITAGSVFAQATQVRVETAADGTGIVVQSQFVGTGRSITAYAVSRDAGGNFIANVLAAWSLENKTGSVVNGDLVPAVDGKSAVFTGNGLGSATIRATSGGLAQTPSGTITVVTPVPVFISPATQHVLPTGGNFTATVEIRNAVNVHAFHVVFSLNNAYIRYAGRLEGTFLSQGGVYSTFFSSNPAPGPSVTSVTVDDAILGSDGVSGNGTLFSITFAPVASGTSAISLDAVDLRDNGNNSYPSVLTPGSVIVDNPSQYTITASAGPNGTIAPSGSVVVADGSNQAFAITPNTGYHVANVLVDGGSVGAVTTYTFTNVTTDHTISASFAINTYTLDVSTTGSGSVTKLPDQPTYNHGSAVQLTATSNPGWTFINWSGDTSGSANPLIVTMDRNKSFTANFGQSFVGHWAMDEASGTTLVDSSAYSNNGTIIGTVNRVPGVRGQALVFDGASTYATVPHSSSLNITNTITIATWVRPDLYATQDLVKKATNGATDGYELTLAAAAGNPPRRPFVRFNQATSADTYRLSARVASEYPVNGTWVHYAATYDGTTMKFYINGVLDTSKAASITIASNNLPLSLGAESSGLRKYTGQMDDARVYNRALSAGEIQALANFTYTITASAGPNGTITPGGAIGVNYGSSQAFTMSPSAGYHVDSVLVDGVKVDSTTSYTFVNVSTNHTIRVVFRINQYTITASAGSNGTITPGGAVGVNYGLSQAFTMSPSAGYHVDSVLVDGVKVDSTTSYTFVNVSTNHTIRAVFRINQYTITPSAGPNGTITPGGAVGVNYGLSQAFTMSPSAGYHVDSVLVDGVKVDSTTSYTFVNVTANHTIRVVFRINQYTITASAGPNGTITPGGAVGVNYGSSQAFTISPNGGYQIDSVIINGAYRGTMSSYTFNNVVGDSTIRAVFKVIAVTHTITATAGANGTISPSGAVSVADGGSQTFTIAPSTGYHIDSVIVNGTNRGTMSSYTFTNMRGDSTIRAAFTINTYTLNIMVVGSGSVGKVPDQSTYNHGTVVQLTATPAGVWTFSNWSGDVSGSTNPLSVTMDMNKNITATFTNTNTLVGYWAMNEGSGTTLVDSSTYGNYGTISGSPSWVTGVKGQALNFNGSSQHAAVRDTPSVRITSAITLAAWIAPTNVTTQRIIAKATMGESDGYELSLGSLGKVFFRLNEHTNSHRLDAVTPYPTTGTSWMHAAATYDGDSLRLYINGVREGVGRMGVPIGTNTDSLYIGRQKDPANPYWYWGKMDEVRVYNRALSISEIQVLASHTITATAGPNGSISPSGAVSLIHGGSQLFTITPNGSYQIDSVIVNGAYRGTMSSYIFNNVIGDSTIRAVFRIIPIIHTITATAGANGSISPAGAVGVTDGGSQTFTITPSVGYHIDSVLVDGGYVGASSNYSFTNVTADHTIRAVFRINQYTITPSAGPNGTITPGGAVGVNHGSSQAFTIAPSGDYHIDSLLVDGVKVDSTTSYTFVNVTANHTIRAVFKINQYTITASAGPNGTISPGGAVGVDYGSSQAFTMSPSAGYHVDSVLVDGVQVYSTTSYTFVNVTQDHTIRASFATNQVTIAVGLNSGWNMISCPVTVANDSVVVLYPTASFAYAYGFRPTIGYEQSYTMPNGPGYWEKFSAAMSQSVIGLPRSVDSISVLAGWNMVGTISFAVDVSTIVSDPAGLRASPWYGYGITGYNAATLLQPGLAYWVKSSAAGKFVLANPLVTRPAKVQSSEGKALDEVLNSLTITDSKGGSQTLYFGADANTEIPVSFYSMPPAPPTGAFDARFATAEGGTMVQVHPVKVSHAVEFPVTTQSTEYPLTVTWKVGKGTASYELTDGLGGKMFHAKEMRCEGSMKITNSSLTKFSVKVIGDGQLPKEFALSQNYPNPFNPGTTITYDLPSDTRVSLKLFNILGQEVGTLVNEEQKAGYKSVQWDGRDANNVPVASGMYLYKIHAGQFTSVKKMLFLK